MRVVILGSGTLEPDPFRGPPAHLVVGEGFSLLWDCGAGVGGALARAGVPPGGLTHIALTHFHVDHVGGLPDLFWALEHSSTRARVEPLVLLGPTGTERLVERLCEAFGDFMRAPGGTLSVVEISPGLRWTDPDGRFALECVATPHSEASVAYRVDAGDARVGYTGDTGPSEEVGRVLGDSHLVICECARSDDQPDECHLGPATIAKMFTGREPDLLVTTHVYGPPSAEQTPDLIRALGYTGSVVAGRDGMDVRVESSGVRVVRDRWSPMEGEC